MLMFSAGLGFAFLLKEQKEAAQMCCDQPHPLGSDPNTRGCSHLAL